MPIKLMLMCLIQVAAGASVFAANPLPHAPVIDGRIHPAEWQQAIHFDKFITTVPNQDDPVKPSQAWWGFDQKNIYLAFDCTEPDTTAVQSKIQQRDGTLWFDDSVEFFFKSAINRPEYYHFIFNASGVVFDQLCRPNEIGVHKNWNALGVTTAAGRTPSGWQVEVSIPLSNFYVTGKTWSMNLARTSHKPSVEYSSIQGVKNGFHRPESFRKVEVNLPVEAFAPGLEVLTVGQRIVGDNVADLLLINDKQIKGEGVLHTTVVQDDQLSVQQTVAVMLDGRVQQKMQVPFTLAQDGPTQLQWTLKLPGNLPTTVGRSLQARAVSVSVNATQHQARRMIDHDQSLVIDGQKVFPLIFYRAPRGEYATLKEFGFNCAEVTNYRNTPDVIREHLQAAQNGGVGLLPHEDYAARRFLLGRMKKTVDLFKDHPNLWAWYLADEPQNYGITPENAQDLYHAIKQTAVDLPVFLLNSEPGLFAKYAPACDIFGVDCYPVPSKPITVIADYIEAAHKAVNNSKPVWFAAQTYGSFKHGGRMPTLDEGRCMIYLALAHGVKGMLFFAYTCEEMGGSLQATDASFYNMTLATGQEIKALSAALTGPQLPQHFKVTDDDGLLHCRLIADSTHGYLLVVNPHPRSVDATIELPRLKDDVTQIMSRDGQVQKVSNRYWSATFKPFGVKVYSFELGASKP